MIPQEMPRHGSPWSHRVQSHDSNALRNSQEKTLSVDFARTEVFFRQRLEGYSGLSHRFLRERKPANRQYCPHRKDSAQGCLSFLYYRR